MAFVPESEQKQRQRALDFQRQADSSSLAQVVGGISTAIAKAGAGFERGIETGIKQGEAEKVAATKAASDLANARAKSGGKGGLTANQELTQFRGIAKDGGDLNTPFMNSLRVSIAARHGIRPGQVDQFFGIKKAGVQEVAPPPAPVAIEPVLPQVPQEPVSAAPGQQVPFAPTGQPQDFVAGLTQGLPAPGTPSVGEPVTTQPEVPDLSLGSEATTAPERLGTFGSIAKTASDRREERKRKEEDRNIRAEKNLGFRRNSREFKVVTDAAKRFDSLLGKNKLTEKLSAAKAILNLIQQKNGLADQTVASQVLRLSGEVGVFTDADIRRASGNPALMNRMERRLSVAATGIITDQDREDIINLTNGMLRAVRGVMRSTGRRVLNTTRAALRASEIDVDDQALSDSLGVGIAQERQGEATLTPKHKILLEALDTGKDPETGEIIDENTLQQIRAKLDRDRVY